jgi:DUF2914 family protein
MNRYTIEKRDQEVVEKFRAVIGSNDRRKRNARVRLFGLLLVIICTGLIVSFKNSSPPLLPERAMNRSNAIALNRTSDNSLSPAKIEETQSEETETTEIAAVAQDTNPLQPLKSQSSEPQSPEPQSPEPVIVEKKVTMEPVPVLKPSVKNSGKIGLSAIDSQVSGKTDIRIAEIVICQGVKNKKAVSPQNVFSLQQGAKPYVWMDVRSKQTPYKLRHVYYLNESRYCEVPLAIHYPRMRTWSNVSLRHPFEAGQWRVDVVTKKGEVLSQVEFTVVP